MLIMMYLQRGHGSSSDPGSMILLLVVPVLVYVVYRLAKTIVRLAKKIVYRVFQIGKKPARHDRPAILTEPPHPSPPARQRASEQVFISYASKDRPTAQTLAAALSKSGCSVWWDRSILPGERWDQVIESALTGANCVVVLWSTASVDSDWVKVEAAEAAKRRILIPAMIEHVTIPLEFRRLQAADLVDWHGSNEHPGFRSLLKSIIQLRA